MGFGFANPNHAAAFICAVIPFCWGWRRWPCLGWLLSALLFVALALTFSRMGFVVLAAEGAAWFLVRRRACRRPLRCGRWGVVAALALVAAALWWMAPRLSMDGAVTNRPKIWLAGLRLIQSNPRGVGFGNSGLLASSFLLPEGVAVRTLVNAHLTLLAETGWTCGGAWLAFIGSALVCGGRLPRAAIAFAGLALSAAASSVFDWHVLFGVGEAAHGGLLNGVLSWCLLALFVSLGLLLLIRGFRPLRVVLVAVAVLVAACGVSLLPPADGTPVVSAGCVRYGRGGPAVLHDGAWTLGVIRGLLPEGAVIRIREGAEAPLPAPAREVWLFGDVAESSDRFPDAEVTVVDPPEFYEPGANVVRVVRGEASPCR